MLPYLDDPEPNLYWDCVLDSMHIQEGKKKKKMIQCISFLALISSSTGNRYANFGSSWVDRDKSDNYTSRNVLIIQACLFAGVLRTLVESFTKSPDVDRHPTRFYKILKYNVIFWKIKIWEFYKPKVTSHKLKFMNSHDS